LEKLEDRDGNERNHIFFESTWTQLIIHMDDEKLIQISDQRNDQNHSVENWLCLELRLERVKNGQINLLLQKEQNN